LRVSPVGQLGKGGSRIQELQKSNGIYGIHVGKEEVNGRVKVSIEAKTVADAQACREAFELEEHRIDTGGIDFNLAAQELDNLKTKSGITIAKIESKSHIVCIGTRESLQTFHTLFGLEKIYLPDIVSRQKELHAVERPSSGFSRTGGLRGRDGMSFSDMRGQAPAVRGGAVADARPVIKPPRQFQQQQQPQQQQQKQPQQQQQQQKQQQPQQQQQQQQQQNKNGRKERSPEPSSIAITVSTKSAGAAPVRTMKVLSEQPVQQQQHQQQPQQKKQQQQQPQEKKQQQQQGKQELQQQVKRQEAAPAAAPPPQMQKDGVDADVSSVPATSGVKPAVTEGKSQRPPKGKPSSSSAPDSSALASAAEAGKDHAVSQAALPLSADAGVESAGDPLPPTPNQPPLSDTGAP
jgi:DNA polymerase III gamma/tau subunit